MKKHQRNATLHTDRHHSSPLTLRRETVRLLAEEDLALVAAGSTTILTEKPTVGQGSAC